MTRKKAAKIKNVLLIQFMVFLYSIASFLTKLASGFLSKGIFSFEFLGTLALTFIILAVYAYFWQRILKKVELSIAYLSKGVGLFWTLLWSALVFKEKITLGNVIGLVIIIAGIIMVNLDQIQGAAEK